MDVYALWLGIRQMSREEMLRIDQAAVAAQRQSGEQLERLLPQLKSAVQSAIAEVLLTAEDLKTAHRAATLEKLGRVVGRALLGQGQRAADEAQRALRQVWLAEINRLYRFAVTMDQTAPYLSAGHSEPVESLVGIWGGLSREIQSEAPASEIVSGGAWARGSWETAFQLPLMGLSLQFFGAEGLSEADWETVAVFKTAYGQAVMTEMERLASLYRPAGEKLVESLAVQPFNDLKAVLDLWLDNCQAQLQPAMALISAVPKVSPARLGEGAVWAVLAVPPSPLQIVISSQPTIVQGSTVALRTEPAIVQGSTVALGDEPAIVQGSTVALGDEPAIVQGSTVALGDEPAMVQGSTVALGSTVSLAAPSEVICLNCGGPVNPGAKFCGHCGHHMEAVSMKPGDSPVPVKKTDCPKCGKPITLDMRFCGHCGYAIRV